MGLLLLCGILICAGSSIALDPCVPFDEELSSSPVIKRLLDGLDLLQRQSAKQAIEIQSLKAEMSQHRGYIKRLRSKLYIKDRLIQTMLSQVGQLTKKASSNDGDINDSKMAPVFGGDMAQRKQLRHIGKRIQPVEHLPVAFSAMRYQNMRVATDENVLFDTLITNVGKAFNQSSGDFIAPVHGIYVFSASILSQEIGRSSLRMVVNKTTKAMLYVNMNDVASQMMVIQLHQGDRVAIMGTGGSFSQIDGLYYTSFSGFLIQQIYFSIDSNSIIG